MNLATCTKALDRFLFASCEPIVASLFRIGFAFLLTIHTVVWMLDGPRWFSNEGVLQASTAQQLGSGVGWSLLFHLPSTPWVIQICLAILLVQSLLLILGVASRFQVACIFVWLVSFQHRNPMICDGEDTLMRLLAFFMIFMPLDHAYSLLNHFKNRKSEPSTRVHAWALRLVQLEMTLLYASAGWSKVPGETWQNGTAMEYVSRMTDVYGRPWIPDAISDMPFLLKLLTWGALGIEIFLPFGLWIPQTRKLAILLGFALHIGIELSMNLFLFEWFMMLGLVAFIRPGDLRVGRSNQDSRLSN